MLTCFSRYLFLFPRYLIPGLNPNFFMLYIDSRWLVWPHDASVNPDSARMLHHHCRRNPELQEELQIQAAVAAGDVHTVRKMLEQGYSPNGRDANGWTLLHFSAARGKERCVRVFLEHGGELPREKNLAACLTIFYPNFHYRAFQHWLGVRLPFFFFLWSRTASLFPFVAHSVNEGIV